MKFQNQQIFFGFLGPNKYLHTSEQEIVFGVTEPLCIFYSPLLGTHKGRKAKFLS